MLGALALHQFHDLTDQETCEQLAFNLQWHYALDQESDCAGSKRRSSSMTCATLKGTFASPGVASMNRPKSFEKSTTLEFARSAA